MKSSLEYLPENLREDELHIEFTGLIDYLIGKYHTDVINKVKAIYNVMSTDFDPEYIFDLLGSVHYKDRVLTESQKRGLTAMIANLYEIKGTEKGLLYILSILGIKANVYEWYYVNEQFAEGNSKFPEEIDSCSIILEVTQNLNTFSLELDTELRALMTQLLWICVVIWEIRFIFGLGDDTSEQLEIRDELYTVVGVAPTDVAVGAFSVCGNHIVGPFPAEPILYDDPKLPFGYVGEGLIVGETCNLDPLGRIVTQGFQDHAAGSFLFYNSGAVYNSGYLYGSASNGDSIQITYEDF